MASPTLPDALRGKIFSASELRAEHPDWSDAMVEDYLSLFENLEVISDVINQKQDILVAVINIDTGDSPFTVNDVDQEYVFDTTLGDILCILNAGVDGRRYRMTNAGTGGNAVVITPDGSELIYGASSENIYDAETLDMTYKSPKGWW